MSLTITQQNQTVLFSGQLDRDTLMMYSPFTLLNTLSGKVTFDFSALTNVDSAGLAWLIQQIARARTMNLQIEISKVPAQLLSLAKVSAVTTILPIID